MERREMREKKPKLDSDGRKREEERDSLTLSLPFPCI